MKKIPLLLTIALLLALPFPAASFSGSATLVNPIVVTTLSDTIGICPAPTCSLRTAIINANTDLEASAITFSVHGTITLTSPLPPFTDANTTTITGPAEGITIDGNNLYALMSVNSGASANLSNLAFVNGHSPSNDGAIFNTGILVVNNSSFQGNTAVFNGGVIYNNGTLNITGSIFTSNQTTSGDGGAIYNTSGGLLTISLSTFTSNQAHYNGGAIYNNSQTGSFPTCGANTLTVDQSTFYENQSVSASGGAIYNDGNCSHSDIQRSLFRSNSAFTYGGGLYQGNGKSVVTNSTFTTNSAPNGAAVNNGTGWEVDLINDTIFSNTPSSSDAMVRNGSGHIYVQNSIIAYATTGAECSGSITNNGNNLDSGVSCGWTSSQGSMSNAYPLLQVLAANGGPTLTLALQPTSAAVDGVTFNAPNGCPAMDQRGFPRPADRNHHVPARCDIGAYELQLMVFLPLVMR